ncbi:MAG: helix-turn-helix transcriptional regulator, partial [Armatimonadia bacterium]
MSQKKQSKEGTALLARFMHWRRMERGYTLKEASHLVGFAGHQSLQKIEKGERRIPLNKVPAIARVYAWDESDLHLLVLLGRLTDEKIDPNVLALHLPRLDAGGGKPTDDP